MYGSTFDELFCGNNETELFSKHLKQEGHPA